MSRGRDAAAEREVAVRKRAVMHALDAEDVPTDAVTISALMSVIAMLGGNGVTRTSTSARRWAWADPL